MAVTMPALTLPTKPNLFGLDLPALEARASAAGQPAYRAKQLYSWLYRRRARSLDDMSDLPKAWRDALAASHELRWPEVAERAESADGTIKFLFRLDDGATIEAVYIPETKRRTICISTQAGCPLKCGFCLTGIAGYKRNLKAWEILGQVATVMHEAPAPQSRAERGDPALPARRDSLPPGHGQTMAWNIVVMGMGEPLLNYDNTVAALRVLMDPEGFAVAPRKLTLSTVGILPGLEKLMQEPVRPNLAISLHAPNPELRRQLMPIEDKYELQDVIEAAQRYPIPRGGLVTYEYVLLGGVNDRPEHARQLVRLLRGQRAKVNLIPLNPAAEIPFDRPTEEAVDTFAGILAAAHLTVSVRRQRGQDILAACGQLHLRRGSPGATATAPVT
jgi:23S rRNA (adenine2503-C2)-methyltransferase